MSRNKYPEETINLIIDVALRLFLEQGYENTSIQDIINGLGGLSKGAIYHHFKSKEEILEAVTHKIENENAALLAKVRDDTTLTGYEKLREIFRVSISSSNQDIISKFAPNIVNNPRFLNILLQQIFSIIAPQYIQPIIEQGILDGSIKTDYPKELSEAMILLTNIYLNPMITEVDDDEMIGRLDFFNMLLKNMGIHLFDEDMKAQYMKYCKLYRAKNS